MANDNIANCIAYFRRKSQDYSFRQLRPIPLLARSLSTLKVIVSIFQKPVRRALNASATAIQNMRVDHRPLQGEMIFHTSQRVN
jgi:hypothetical protein